MLFLDAPFQEAMLICLMYIYKGITVIGVSCCEYPVVIVINCNILIVKI